MADSGGTKRSGSPSRRPRKRARISQSSCSDEPSPTCGSPLKQMLDSIDGWAAKQRLKIQNTMESNGGLGIIDDFLPRPVAEETRDMVFSLGPGSWSLNEDDGDVDDIPHSFLSCIDNIADINRILWSIMPEKLPSFSAGRYMQGHSIARHNDELTVSDGCGGMLRRDIALVLYLVDDEWSSKDGGVLLDYGHRCNTVPQKKIIPKFNRLVVFKVPRDHEVLPVTVEDDVDRPRLSIFGWYLDPVAEMHTKSDASSVCISSKEDVKNAE